MWAKWVIIVSFFMRVWIYQALLDLYTVLRSPNQGALAGHMPVPTFLQFTESVTFGMFLNQSTAPHPLRNDDSDSDSDGDKEVLATAEEFQRRVPEEFLQRKNKRASRPALW